MKQHDHAIKQYGQRRTKIAQSPLPIHYEKLYTIDKIFSYAYGLCLGTLTYCLVV